MKILVKVWQFLYNKKTYIGAIMYLLGKYVFVTPPVSSLLIEIASLIMGVGLADKTRRMIQDKIVRKEEPK